MRILYGVVGEGMGHATRSRVVIAHLLEVGHTVRVVVSGRAHRFLREAFAGQAQLSLEEIHGFHLNYEGNALDRSKSLRTNLTAAPRGLLKNIGVYRKVAEDGFSPELVVSDFESWAYLYALNHRLPVISIDNQQVVNRCDIPPEVTDGKSLDHWMTQLAVKLKLPGAYHYLVTSFFFPRVRKPRTTLVPPILRPEILAAKREPGRHVLVYQTAAANTELVPTLQALPYEFRVYGMGREGREGNVTLCAFSQHGFVDDLRTARAVVAGGGYSLMGEAVHLHVPMFSVPVEKQFEQELNARYLAHLGYGAWAKKLETAHLANFLAHVDDHAHVLASYEPHDNSLLLGCLDELVDTIASEAPRPLRLRHASMGSFQGETLPEEHTEE
ncbi:MAG: glycosyltransferase family protein [Myxococcota bacterium]